MSALRPHTNTQRDAFDSVRWLVPGHAVYDSRPRYTRYVEYPGPGATKIEWVSMPLPALVPTVTRELASEKAEHDQRNEAQKRELITMLLRPPTFSTLKAPERAIALRIAAELGVDPKAVEKQWSAECCAILDADTARIRAERALSGPQPVLPGRR